MRNIILALAIASIIGCVTFEYFRVQPARKLPAPSVEYVAEYVEVPPPGPPVDGWHVTSIRHYRRPR